MKEILNISSLFKQYILSLDKDLYRLFSILCLGDTKFTLDEYCDILKQCIEKQTTYNYPVICWRSKTQYENSSIYSKGTFDVLGNAITDKISYSRNIEVRPSYPRSYLEIAYYHLDNTIDDEISTFYISNSIYGVKREYTLDGYLRFGGYVFLLLPASGQDANTALKDFYKSKFGVDLDTVDIILSICRLCNGWYKYLLRSLDILPSRSILCFYKEKKKIYLSRKTGNNMSDKKINRKRIIQTSRYEEI